MGLTTGPVNTAGDRAAPARIARLFASPAGVLILLPALVIAAGVVVLLLGRRATRDTAETMARNTLVAQAQSVQHDVGFALDQAGPVLAMMHSLSDTAMATPDAMTRLRDIVVNRPGIANASIAFPIGVLWGSYLDRKTGAVNVFESRITETETTRTNFRVESGQIQTIDTKVDNYDPRARPHYTVAVEQKKRVWLPPRVLSSSGKTALTVSEPVYSSDGTLTAVLTLDFEVAELSEFIRKSPLAGARNVMFTADGTILAYPAVSIPETSSQEKRLLRHEDFKDPALEALFKALGSSSSSEQKFMHLDTTDGNYLASVSKVGDKRSTDDAKLDWYLATLVPERTLSAIRNVWSQYQSWGVVSSMPVSSSENVVRSAEPITEGEMCAWVEGLLDQIVVLAGGKAPTVDHEACVTRGDAACLYRIVWYR